MTPKTVIIKAPEIIMTTGLVLNIIPYKANMQLDDQVPVQIRAVLALRTAP